MKMLPVLTTAAAALVLQGCATVADSAAKAANAPVCCKSFAELPVERFVQQPEPVPVQWGDGAPAFDFPSGRSYFKGYELPAGASRLLVRSWATGSTAFETRTLSQVFCPVVTFLDSQRSVVSMERKVPDWASRAHPQFRAGMPSFVANLDVPPAARFVVLHTDPAMYGIPVTRLTGGGGYMVGSTFVYNAGGEPIRHPCGPHANAEVSIL